MRSAGILLHPTSLPGPGPCGSLGSDARRFITLLAETGSGLWQVLPLHPPSIEGSPYDSPSAFAIDPRMIDLWDLVEDGLLTPAEVGAAPQPSSALEAPLIEAWHKPRLYRAALRLAQAEPDRLHGFIDTHPWARDWARFVVLRERHGGRGWWTWPQEYRFRSQAALAAVDKDCAQNIAQEIAIQLIAGEQWARTRAHAAAAGVHIIGDVPIFVCRDGADTWTDRDLFRLDEDGRPDPSTGVPPDVFSETGQWWNNPHYAWSAHEQSGFAWWIRRLEAAMERHDTIRIDHFRGLCAAWAIPATAGGDARQGQWEPAPGAALLAAAQQALPGLDAIAEDLGLITPDVTALRQRLGWPGMKVLQFGFSADGQAHLPPYDSKAWVAYSGTHDNNTTRAWYAEASAPIRAAVDRWAGLGSPCPDPAQALVRGAWMSKAKWAIAPLQDLLGLGADARMNHPGTRDGNWRWRSPPLNTGELDWLSTLNRTAGRFLGATEAL